MKIIFTEHAKEVLLHPTLHQQEYNAEYLPLFEFLQKEANFCIVSVIEDDDTQLEDVLIQRKTEHNILDTSTATIVFDADTLTLKLKKSSFSFNIDKKVFGLYVTHKNTIYLEPDAFIRLPNACLTFKLTDGSQQPSVKLHFSKLN
jgi:hypothetical protein